MPEPCTAAPCPERGGVKPSSPVSTIHRSTCDIYPFWLVMIGVYLLGTIELAEPHFVCYSDKEVDDYPEVTAHRSINLPTVAQGDTMTLYCKLHSN